MRRLSYVQQRIIDELRRRPQQSYDDIAAAVGADRTSVITGVRVLMYKRIVVRLERGRGSVPNRYHIPPDR